MFFLRNVKPESFLLFQNQQHLKGQYLDNFETIKLQIWVEFSMVLTTFCPTSAYLTR